MLVSVAASYAFPLWVRVPALSGYLWFFFSLHHRSRFLTYQHPVHKLQVIHNLSTALEKFFHVVFAQLRVCPDGFFACQTLNCQHWQQLPGILQPMNTERQQTMTISKPDIQVEFDHRIRDEWVYVKASAWYDYEGIYKTRIDGVFLDDANVTGLLTDFDLADIDQAIEPAVRADIAQNAIDAGIPGPFPTL